MCRRGCGQSLLAAHTCQTDDELGVAGPAGQASCGNLCCAASDSCLNAHTSQKLPICCSAGHFNCGGSCCATGNSCTQDTLSGDYVCCESLAFADPLHGQCL